jgi:hypothetical protein
VGPERADNYYARALGFVRGAFPSDLEWVRSRSPDAWDQKSFLAEYSWVVFVSGFHVGTIARLWPELKCAFLAYDSERIVAHKDDVLRLALSVFRNERKIRAVIAADDRLVSLPNPIGDLLGDMDGPEFVEWISDWPFMGRVNRLFLARNIGFEEYSKPDIHLTRLARRFGYDDDVARLCADLARAHGVSPGEIDIVLWRFASEGEPDSLQRHRHES